MDENAKALARPAASRSLRAAMHQARLEEAERLDETADTRDAEIARLELLKAELEPAFADIPGGEERFGLALVQSRPARLWIDLFTYAAVDDNGTYLLVRNSEAGRKTLFYSANIGEMADRIVMHVARTLVARERQEARLFAPAPSAETDAGARGPSGPRTSVVMLAFIMGLVTGAAGLFATVWLSVP